MSSKIKKIRENVEAAKKLEAYTLYGSLCGSIIVTIGKLVGKKEDEMTKDFARFSKDEVLAKSKNILEVVDYIIKDFNMPEEYKKYIVLCYDEDNKYTPIVTVVDEEGCVQPLDRDGNYLGILAQFGEKESIKIEEIYAETED